MEKAGGEEELARGTLARRWRRSAELPPPSPVTTRGNGGVMVGGDPKEER
jgi:hypothetical protein